MALKDLLNKMKEKFPASDVEDKGLPSDSELQSAKQRRRQSANDVTDYLAGKGYPTLGAIAGTATDLSADLIPESREDWMKQLGEGGNIGSVGKVAPKLGALTKSTKEVLKDVTGNTARKGTVSPLSFKNVELRHAALRDPEVFDLAKNLGEEGSEAALKAGDKLKDAGIQRIKDVQTGTAKAGSLSAKSAPSEIDYSKLEAAAPKEAERVIDYRSLKEKMPPVSENVISYDKKGVKSMRKRRPGEEG